MIPSFNDIGNLPPGIHEASWSELETGFGGSPRRVTLLSGLREALIILRDAGCRIAYIDGSFVTTKKEPGDFDACWDLDGVDVDALDPVLLEFGERRRAQKERFGGELFLADAPAEPGGTRFLDYFQRDRDTGEPKGIIQFNLEALA